MSIQEMLSALIGEPTIFYNTITDINSNTVSTVVPYYDLSYIVASIIFICFIVGVIAVILNFQKSFNRGAK